MEQDKINAYMTLYTVLETMVKLAAPFTPFITEEIYGNLVKKVDAGAPESVHLCDWPAYHAEWVDADLEENMDFVLKVVVEGPCGKKRKRNEEQTAFGYDVCKGSTEPARRILRHHQGRAECEGSFLHR